MLHLKGINYSIVERILLHNLDWIIPPGKRFALIGENGVGKTTLLRVMTGELTPFSGRIMKPKEYKMGYLPQEEIGLEPDTILNFVLKGRPDLLELEDSIQTLRSDIANSSTERQQAGVALASLEHQYEHLGGYRLESEAKEILAGLGFEQKSYQRSLHEFSGGWRMRVYLGRLLLQRPDLLLLDEPTNHLDLSALEWLEDYLLRFDGSVIIVSHDRFFIDRIAGEICELVSGELKHYVGKYHDYEKQKAKERALLEKKSQQLEKERQKQQAFIDRFRYKNTKASQVQSRIKMLEKKQDIELEAADSLLNFQLAVDSPSYKDVLFVDNVSFRYTDDWVFQDINLQIYRGQKIALVGDNGAGKTTLTRLIVDQLAPQRGELIRGKRVSIGYYAQHQVDALDINSTVYDEVVAAVAKSQIPNVRNILGLFGLRGENIYKKIDVLSGGEKARVSLAKILLSPVNFLIMDEPTNHLDIRSKEALENALLEYDGTLILISHDRYFLDKIVHKVIELFEGHLYEYEGDYSAYLEKRKERRPQPIDAEKTKISKKSKDEKRKQAEARQAVSKKRNLLHQSIQDFEVRIEKLERRKGELEKLLGDPESYKSGDSAASLNQEYHQTIKDIESHLEAWAVAQEELEELLKQLGRGM